MAAKLAQFASVWFIEY